MNIGNQIKAIRISKGMTQKDLAERLKISAAAISQFEQKESLNLDTLQRIAEALNCRIDELMDIHIDTPIPKKRLSQKPKDVSEAEALKSLITLLDYAQCDIALSTTELKRILEITKELHKALIKDFKENSDYSIIK